MRNFCVYVVNKIVETQQISCLITICAKAYQKQVIVVHLLLPCQQQHLFFSIF